MGKIFGKNKKEGAVMAQPPVSQETPGEIKAIEKLSNPEVDVQEVVEPVKTTSQEVSYREIPVCMSPSQINNLVIENNIMLKQIISSMED